MSNQFAFISASTLAFLRKDAHLLRMTNSRFFLSIPALALLTVCALFYASSSQAQDITAEEAQRLQGVFQTILEDKKSEITANAEKPYELKLKGDVTVEPAGTYYAITMPQITLSYPNGDRLEIGLLSMNASPDETPGQFKMTMALPTPILGFDKNDQETLRITIGGQKAAGIWHEALQNFVKLDALFSDIQMTLDSGRGLIALPETRIVYDLTEGENGRWSGPTFFEAKNVNISSTEGVEASIARVAMEVTLDQFAPEAFQNTPQSKIATLDLADGADFKLSIEDFNTSKDNADGVNEAIFFKQAGINFSYDEALSGSVDANLSFSFTDVSQNNAPTELIPFLPKSGQFKLTHHNIPLAAMNDIMQNSAEGGMKILGLGMLLKVPAILAQAGSYIDLHETNIQNENYNIELNTILRADIAAANSATANGTLRFAGLDKVLSLAQVEGRNLGSSEYAQPMRTLARFLERLKPLGRVETDEQDGFVHVFDLEMNKAGQTLINGQNMQMLFDEPANKPEDPTPQPLPQGTEL